MLQVGFEVWLFCELSRNLFSCWSCLSCDIWILQHLVSSAWGLQGVYPPEFSFMSAPRKRGHIVVSDLDRRAAVAHGFVAHFIAAIFIFVAGWCACFIWLLKLGD